MIDHNNTLPTLKYKNTMMMLGSRHILPLETEAPIKNTSLSDKKQLVGNFDKCKTIFKKFAKKHNWIDTSSIDYEFIATQMVIEARAVHKKYNKCSHLRLVWNNPWSGQLH